MTRLPYFKQPTRYVTGIDLDANASCERPGNFRNFKKVSVISVHSEKR